MANTQLIAAAEKLYGSEAMLNAGPDWSKLLDPAISELKRVQLESEQKTKDYIDALPEDINLAKVPENLKWKVTEYLTNAKQEYVKAAQDAAKYKSTDQRYIDAVQTMNKIKQGYINVSQGLDHLVNYRTAAIENHEDWSDWTSDSERETEEKLIRGEFEYITIDNDGVFLGLDKDRKNITSLKNNVIDGGVGTTAARSIDNNVVQNASKGFKFDEGNVRSDVDAMFTQLGKDGIMQFAFDGVFGDKKKQTPFVNVWIEEALATQGIVKGSENYETEFQKLKNEIRGKKLNEIPGFEERFENYLVDAYSDRHDFYATQYKETTKTENKLDSTEEWQVDFVERIRNKESLVYDKNGIEWRLNDDGNYETSTETAGVFTVKSPYEMEKEFGGRFAKKEGRILTQPERIGRQKVGFTYDNESLYYDQFEKKDGKWYHKESGRMIWVGTKEQWEKKGKKAKAKRWNWSDWDDESGFETGEGESIIDSLEELHKQYGSGSVTTGTADDLPIIES